MRLADFILANLEPILQAWENFARSLTPGNPLTVAGLRDDAERMLLFIAQDMETRQDPREQFLKSIGARPQTRGEQQTAAQEHGLARAVNRFSLSELVSEYRALRASVLSLWLNSADADKDVQQIIRFNEAVDQLIAESVSRYSSKLDQDADVFTASIGHDLRNPLNAIAMSARLLDSARTLSNVEKRAVNQIEQSAVRMGTMVGELQDFSRVRLTGMLTVEREPMDVARLCTEVIQEIRASTPGCRITFSQAGDTVASVSDERIGQLLSNLIGNAVEHGAPGADVEVTVTGEDQAVSIYVRNAGPAIPAEALTRIFEPLYRTDSSAQQNRMHLGLGLYIARTIARAHGGDISVTSEDGSTTFQVHLPRKPRAHSD